MQHVHGGHAGTRVRDVGRELVARDATHVQVREAALQRVADFDPRFPCRRIEQHEQAARCRPAADAAFTKDPLGLRVDGTGFGDRDDVHVDAEIRIEIVGHATEARTERREDARRIGDAWMAWLGGNLHWRRGRARARAEGLALLPIPGAGRGHDGEQGKEQERAAVQSAPRLQRKWP